MGAEFNVGKEKIVFDWDTEEYTNFRGKFSREKEELLKQFYNEVDTADNTIENVENLSCGLISKVGNLYYSFSNLYMEKGYFQFSRETITLDDAFEEEVLQPIGEIIDKLQSTLQAAEEYKDGESQRRAIRKEGRTRVIGGGFGVGGFVQGALTAGAINGVTGLAHGMFNMIGNIVTSVEVSGMKKKALKNFKYEIKSNASDILDVVRRIILNQLNIKTNLNISGAETILENIGSGVIKEEMATKALIQAITYNPYEIRYYVEYLDRVPEAEDDIYNVASYFQISVQNIKNQLHMFDGFYFDNAQDKVFVSGVTKDILRIVGAKYSVEKIEDVYDEEDLYSLIGSTDDDDEEIDDEDEEIEDDDVKEFEDLKNNYKTRYIYDRYFWRKNLDVKLLDEIVEKLENSIHGGVSSQVSTFIENKVSCLQQIKQSVESKVSEISALYENNYFQDIVRAIIISSPSDSSWHIAKLPSLSLKDSEMNAAFRGYLNEFKIKRENVYLLCDDPDSNDSGHAHGFAITYDGFFNSNGYYYTFDQIVDAKVVDGRLYLVDAEENENFFMGVTGNDTAEYFNLIFGFIFHPETITDELLTDIKMQLAKN